jgi:2-polyprenyl-3-methyl-5-hydroxy-6-metoxy-1,4-benzoquinol methylase
MEDLNLIPFSNPVRPDFKLMNWNVSLPFNYFKGLLLVNRPPVEGTFKVDWGEVCDVVDDDLLEEISDYLIRDIDKESYYDISGHREIINPLKDRNYEQVHNYMKVMFSRAITNDIAQGDQYYRIFTQNKDDIQKNVGFAIYDKIFSLMESVGLIPTFSPEEYNLNNNYHRFYLVPVDVFIEKLSTHLGADINAPKYSGHLFGLKTEKHGLYSDRDLMSLGAAIRIHEKYWNNKNLRIIDIGGGVGHLSYYLYKLGFTNITTLDVPSVNAAAMYFLGTNLPDHNIKFKSPHDFTGDYDLVINVDGITQMKEDLAKVYMNRMHSDGTKHFYSVNREVDSFTVGAICPLARVSRNPFWLRKGYVEEDYFGRLK